MATKKELVQVFEWILEEKEIQFKNSGNTNAFWVDLDEKIFIKMFYSQSIDESLSIEKGFEYRLKPRYSWYVGQTVFVITKYGVCMGNIEFLDDESDIMGVSAGKYYYEFNLKGQRPESNQVLVYPHEVKIVKA